MDYGIASVPGKAHGARHKNGRENAYSEGTSIGICTPLLSDSQHTLNLPSLPLQFPSNQCVIRKT